MFQSTPACERATLDDEVATLRVGVSIHARVRAGDEATRLSSKVGTVFQSTPACERATANL